jgi:hypothetical protein
MCSFSFSHDLDPGKALMSNSYRQIGGLCDDSRIGTPTFRYRLGSEALVLLVGNRRNNQLSCLDPTRFAQYKCRAHYGGDAPLHILRSTAIKSTVALCGAKRSIHAIDAYRVSMTAKHQ